MSKSIKYHEPVLLEELLEYLHINNQAYIIDATLGTGGHAIEIINLGSDLLGIETDEETLEIAKHRISTACSASKDKYTLVRGNFRDIDEIAKENGFSKVDGILFDLGVNNLQLTSPNRGMSFSNPKAELDMRLDRKSQGVTASDLLSSLREDQLIDLFSKILTKGESRKLTKEIVERRVESEFKTVGDFLETTESVLKDKDKLHPATRAFLALRIAVNSELDNLKEALPKALSLLKPGGRIAVISFHSGEDKIVKDYFKDISSSRKGLAVTKKPVKPSEREVSNNPRSRSAKLRVIEKK